MLTKTSLLNTSLLALAITLFSSAALAAPTLKADVSVVGAIVTVGDMFDDAGLLAERALFRAPAPGTTGLVSLDAVHEAARRAGLSDYDQEGILQVRVARSATLVDASMLTRMITDDLEDRGLVPEGVEIEARFDRPNPNFNAEAVADPVQLTNLRYQPGGKSFSARFLIAGIDLPVDITGSLDLMVEVPHLANSLEAGTVLSAADIEMKKVPVDYADTTGIENIDQLVGKSLRRNARVGLMLKASDVTEPLVIKRNANVLVLFHSGPMVLSVQGLALGDASAGQPVQVLNTVSKKILNGVATAGGTVEVGTTSLQIAGL